MTTLGESLGVIGLDEYQQAARRTDDKNGFESERARLACWGLGLTGEAGEVADLIKKHLFHGRELDRPKLAGELGDTLWYLAMTADAIGYTLGDVARLNVEKLRARYPNGFSHAASAARADVLAADREANPEWYADCPTCNGTGKGTDGSSRCLACGGDGFAI